jgi:hypothetical protein
VSVVQPAGGRVERRNTQMQMMQDALMEMKMMSVEGRRLLQLLVRNPAYKNHVLVL